MFKIILLSLSWPPGPGTVSSTLIFNCYMYKLVLFILPFLGAGNRQGHRFEIKFYNVKDSCIRTINESGIEKVDWTNQQYSQPGHSGLSETATCKSKMKRNIQFLMSFSNFMMMNAMFHN